MGKSDAVEGQESLHTASGSPSYYCSATVWYGSLDDEKTLAH
jgi:hypothetical protein